MVNIDELAYISALSSDQKAQKQARSEIRAQAKQQGIVLASTNSLYRDFGKGNVSGFTVPACNIRFLTYDTASVVFQIAKKLQAPYFIFEIAQTEQTYTAQNPDEYVTSILAGAISQSWTGPVYIQGDHYQFRPTAVHENKEREVQRIMELISDSVSAGFFNIDIDASTLVDYSLATEEQQQSINAEMTSRLVRYIRSIQPKDQVISIGGEIGHIGGKNSTVSEFEAFMNQMGNQGSELSKISIQTGTTHGGVPLPDGTIAQVSVDFDALSAVSTASRRYGMGGAVQHGASTLPHELFSRFPETGTVEIHLATGLQNIVFDHLPDKVKGEMYAWIEKDCISEKKPDWTREQFLYKTRKKTAGQFKERLWKLSHDEKAFILQALRLEFEFLFTVLKVAGRGSNMVP